jgi:hypothetical protein
MVVVFEVWIKRKVLSCSGEGKKIEIMSKAPIITLISNCSTGLPSIRALRRDKILVEKLEGLLNENLKFFYFFQLMIRLY